MVDLHVLTVPARDVSEVVAEFLRLVNDATRRRIFLLLMEGEICNCELSDRLALPQNLISHHIRQFRNAGLVQSRRDPQDQRWIYFRVDTILLAQIHEELSAVFDPASVGDRAAECGPMNPPPSSE